jgi:CheY-like chemotaxis protein
VVMEAAGGEQGLAELLRAQQAAVPYALVLLDCRMPVVDGFQVAEQIHQHPTMAGTTILMLTSDNRAGDFARSRDLGVAAYLVKPVKHAELLEAIQQARAGAAALVEPAAPGGGREGARGLRILLAEDSLDNALLIQAYLKPGGCRVDLARDGNIALQMCISGTYDVVLMDVQMPVMDGYTATRRIRQWEGEHRARPVPILALTAHALPEEVQKSLDAGCTAHLTKPIRKATLLHAIEEHTMGRVHVRVDAGLAELIPGFLENRRKDVEAIAAALACADYEHVRILGHNMKGSGAGYGLDRITEIGASLEQAAGRREPEEIRARAAELARYVAALHVDYE